MTQKQVFHISHSKLHEIARNPDMKGKYIVIRTVAMEMRLLEALIDMAIIVGLSALLGQFVQVEGESWVKIIRFAGIPVPIFLLYYFISEGFFKTTLGKKVFGHIIVKDDLSEINIGNALQRTLLRLIPFEPFTCMGDVSYGFHDRFSHTFVITKQEKEKLENMY